MVQNTIQKMAKSIGYDIGLTDNIAQADLLNGFSEGILNSIKEKSGFETQVVGIVEELNPKAIKLIKEINEFIILKEKDNGK